MQGRLESTTLPPGLPVATVPSLSCGQPTKHQLVTRTDSEQLHSAVAKQLLRLRRYLLLDTVSDSHFGGDFGDTRKIGARVAVRSLGDVLEIDVGSLPMSEQLCSKYS